MSKTLQKISEIKLVGISTRTSNECEMNSDAAKIGATMQKFFGSGMQEHIFA